MLSSEQIRSAVDAALASTPFIDVHTHLFKPSLGGIGLWGIDELITYHYLEAELFRSSSVTPAEYFNLSKEQKADLIWRTLFVENAPVSEATRGVVAVLHAFDLPTSGSDLKKAREFFAAAGLSRAYRGRVQAGRDQRSGDDQRSSRSGGGSDVGEGRAGPSAVSSGAASRSHPEQVAGALAGASEQGLQGGRKPRRQFGLRGAALPRRVDETDEVRSTWPCSLPDTFAFPENSVRAKLLAEAVLPVCREYDVPLSLMIGVRYQVNPTLRLAGDGVGKADLRALERLCCEFPGNRFLSSVLSRENQHELTVYARKFSNLMLFGCWWFLNNPSVVEEITRERLEMMGTTFIPQHSDARVLEQVIYKWRNTRRTMAPILANTYSLLSEDGRAVNVGDIQQDVKRLFRTNFERWACLR